MNLQDFQLLKEDQDSYEIKHPKGKSLRVGKSGLSSKAHAAIKKLKPQHFDDGGDVAGDRELASDNSIPYQGVPDSQLSGAQMKQRDDAMDAQKAQVEADQAQAAAIRPAPGSQPAGVPDVNAAAVSAAPFGRSPSDATDTSTVTPSLSGPGAPVEPLAAKAQGDNDILSAQQGDVRNWMTADKAARDKAIAASMNYASAQDKMKTANDIIAAHAVSDAEFAKQLQSQTIDPNRYWKEKSTGSKILSAIAMAVGGGGAALAGQAPAAQQSLNKAIDNDIEAQKNDQSKTMNLWKMNREQMGSELEANKATQNQMYTIAQAKIQAAMAGSDSAKALLQGNQMINELEKQKVANRIHLGALGAASNSQSGGLLQSDPAQLVSLVPPEHQKQFLTEVGQAQSAVRNEKDLLSNYDSAVNQNTVMKTGAGLLRTPPSVKNLNALADPLIHDNEGRINELEQKHVQALFPQPGDLDSTISQKRAAFQDFINHKKVSPTAAAFGIPLNRFQSTAGNPQGLPVFKTMDGVRYQQVPGGWKKVQ
jgi:hypothetical protein